MRRVFIFICQRKDFHVTFNDLKVIFFSPKYCERNIRVCFIHCVRSEVVQQGTEGQAIPPGGGEVGDLHPAVILGDLSAPDQQRLARVGLPS